MENTLRLFINKAKTSSYLRVRFPREFVELTNMEAGDKLNYHFFKKPGGTFALCLSFADGERMSNNLKVASNNSGALVINVPEKTTGIEFDPDFTALVPYQVQENILVLNVPAELEGRKEKGFHLLAGKIKSFRKVKAA